MRGGENTWIIILIGIVAVIAAIWFMYNLLPSIQSKSDLVLSFAHALVSSLGATVMESMT